MNNLPETIQLLMTYLKDHEGKEVRFLLADAFVKGTLDRAPNNPQDGFTLTNVTYYALNSKKQELEQMVFNVSQIMGWGGDSLGFLDAKE